MAVMWGVVILCGICSIALLRGKGAWLIAGYNTANDKEKAKYNEKRLCRVTGAGMGVITLLTLVWAVFWIKIPEWFFGVYMAGVILTAGVSMILANTVCKTGKTEAGQAEIRRTEAGQTGTEPAETGQTETGQTETGAAKREEAEEQNRKRKKWSILSLVFCGVLFLGIEFVTLTGNIKTQVDGEKLFIDGVWWKDYTVSLKDIENVRLEENLDKGRRTRGYGDSRLLQGNFKNEEFGAYILYAYTKCDTCVVMETKQGVVAVSQKTEEETEKLYEEIQRAVQR